MVDDGSTDNTRGVLDQLAAQFPDRCTVLALKENQGKAEAVRQGLLFALNRDNRFVGYWDADLATPLDDVDRFALILEQQSQLRIALGARVKLLGRHVDRNPTRHIAGRVFATVVSQLLDLPVYDTQCGAKLFVAGDWLRQICDEPFLSRWIFDVELIFRFLEQGGRADEVVEVPLLSWTEIGDSKIRSVDLVRVPVDLWRVAKRYRG
jgi:glycosyltransferase involved in cell wall biosynthesis